MFASNKSWLNLSLTSFKLKCKIPRYMHVPRSVRTIYVYENSMCRYVRLSALNVPHVPKLASSPPRRSLSYPSSKCFSSFQNSEVICNAKGTELKNERFEGCVGFVVKDWILKFCHRFCCFVVLVEKFGCSQICEE